ncbi:MAG: ferritin-like domain-containing protein, partial [Pseudomonadota bacterium]
EMEHADSLIERILMLEGFPNMQELDPLMIGQDIKEILECDLKAEYSARKLYMEARDACRKADDYVSMNLFESLIKDEEGHIDWLETQLDNLKAIGIENYGQLQSAPADESED